MGIKLTVDMSKIEILATRSVGATYQRIARARADRSVATYGECVVLSDHIVPVYMTEMEAGQALADREAAAAKVKAGAKVDAAAKL